MRTTRVRQHVQAGRGAVYRALIDAGAVAAWRVPPNMRSRVHRFEAREGGAIRVELTYDDSAGSHVYQGRFVRLVPDEQVVEELEFETGDDGRRGLMTITTTLTDAAGGGTEVVLVHENVPPGVSLEENELGTRLALEQLARYVDEAQRA